MEGVAVLELVMLKKCDEQAVAVATVAVVASAVVGVVR